MTHGKQIADTEFSVELLGENSGTHVVSRAVARDESKQRFLSKIEGKNKCSGHTECDAIIMDSESREYPCTKDRVMLPSTKNGRRMPDSRPSQARDAENYSSSSKRLKGW